MQPIRPVFPGSDGVTIVYAENQPEFVPLPTIRTDKLVLSRWRLTDEERTHIASGGDLFLFQMTFGHPLQAMKPMATSDEEVMQEFIEQG